jgi:hypothetical protein
MLPWRLTLKRNCACIEAWSNFTAYPPLGGYSAERLHSTLVPDNDPAPIQDFYKQVTNDLKELSKHLATSLELEAAEALPSDAQSPTRGRDAQKPREERKVHLEPPMQHTWLVSDVDQFFATAQPTSGEDRLLDIQLAHNEWYAIFVGALGVHSPENEATTGHGVIGPNSHVMLDFEEDIPNYPMLSRYKDCLQDVAYRAAELPALRHECLKLKGDTSNQLAQQGLDKLANICAEAEKASLSVYFLGP